MLTADSGNENVVSAAAGTMASGVGGCKLSIAVCTTAGGQMVVRPVSSRYASATAVTAATINAAPPTSGPEVTTIGTCATATSGIVHNGRFGRHLARRRVADREQPRPRLGTRPGH
jgi:hypothetical protein